MSEIFAPAGSLGFGNPECPRAGVMVAGKSGQKNFLTTGCFDCGHGSREALRRL